MKCARCGTEARQLWLPDLCAACCEDIKSRVEHAVRYADIVAAAPSTAYQDSETENARLRATLEWLASKLCPGVEERPDGWWAVGFHVRSDWGPCSIEIFWNT